MLQNRITAFCYSVIASPAAVGAVGGLATALSIIVTSQFFEQESIFAYMALATGLILAQYIFLLLLLKNFVKSNIDFELQEIHSFKHHMIFSFTFFTTYFPLYFGQNYYHGDVILLFNSNFLVIVVGLLSFTNTRYPARRRDSDVSET